MICPYCQAPAEFMESSASIYHGIDYGPIWICRTCDAWVGVHKGTTKPLGRLANKELRKAKMAVHAAFDPIWRNRLAKHSATNPQYTKQMARGGRYKKLAQLMGMQREDCHIGMFDLDQCVKAIAICKSGGLDK